MDSLSGMLCSADGRYDGDHCQILEKESCLTVNRHQNMQRFIAQLLQKMQQLFLSSAFTFRQEQRYSLALSYATC